MRQEQVPETNGSWETFTRVSRVALHVTGAFVAGYHGYRRDDSVLWAGIWGLLGGFSPEITLPVVFAQGFAQRKER